MRTKTNSGNSELRERRRSVRGKRSEPKSEGKGVNSWGGRDRRAKTKIKSRRSKAGQIERRGNTEKLSCMFILSCSSVCPPVHVFLYTVYYFAVAPTPTSRYTREYPPHHTRVNPSLHARICYLACDLYCTYLIITDLAITLVITTFGK